MIRTLLLKSSFFRDNTFHGSALRQKRRLKLSLKQPQLPKSSLINLSLQTTLADYNLLLKIVMRMPRQLLHSRHVRSQQRMNKLRRRHALLNVQTRGKHPVDTARRRRQRSAQSRLRFYYCCFSLL